MTECKICGKQTSNKTYCSRQCQTAGNKEAFTKPKAVRTCLYCNNEFTIKKSRLKIKGAGKYCSRACKDIHQKEIYTGENSPSRNVKVTQEQRQKRSESMKKMWESPEYREKVKSGIQKYIDENGHYPGMDEKSFEKRKKTLLENYGVDHNWKGKYGNRKCDITYIERYGKTSYEDMVNALKDYQIKTRPEKLCEEYLKSLEVTYEYQYKLQNRYYDFAIPSKKILIEIDGDYFHGKDKKYKELDEIQKKVRRNDKHKNRIAVENGWTLIRLWETDIYKASIEDIKNMILV